MKKNFKKLFIGILALVLVLNYFSPISIVFAEGGYKLTFKVKANTNHTMEIDSSHLKIDGQFVELRDGNDSAIGVSECSSATECSITVNSNIGGSLNFNGANKFSLFEQNIQIGMDRNFNANAEITVQDYEEMQNDHGAGSVFDGKAYLVWSCKNGGVCYHYFDNIPVHEDGSSEFYKASDVKDDATNEEFVVDAEYKGWYLKQDFEDWAQAYKQVKNINGDIDWKKVDPQVVVGEPIDMREFEDKAISAGLCSKESMAQDEFENCVNNYALSTGAIWTGKLQPLPDEPTDNNAYVSYGDRNFKVVVYNKDYKGVSIGDLSDLTYYPASYTNAFIRQDQFDISGTSKSNPTSINTVLLENTVNIKTLNYNLYSIVSIEALDVPTDAVSISKVNGQWKLVFSSNFYDNVIFKATDSNGGVQYFKIHRYTIDGYLRHMDHTSNIYADFFFDRKKSYKNFDITAKIVYKDGTIKKVSLEAVYGIDDGLGNITEAYEVDEELEGEFGAKGKGLKKSTFKYALEQGEEDTIDKIYLNIEYKGSTASNYAGAFAGSGQGIVITVGEEQ